MNKERILKILSIVFPSGVFAVVCLMTVIFGNYVYIFEWMKYNFHFQCMLWIVVLILQLFKKRIIAIYISLGNPAGIIGGQFIGDWIRSTNMAKITDGMSAEQIYHLSKHYGVFIWFLILVIFAAVGCVLYLFRKKEPYHKKAVS